MKRFLTVLALLISVGFVRAADAKVEAELNALLDDAVANLKKLDQTAIRIGKFTAEGDVPANYGPELQRVLGIGFAARKITVNKDALIELKGDYAPADENPDEPRLKQVYVRINAVFVNTKTRLKMDNITIVSRAVYGNDALREVFAPTVALPPSADNQARNDELRDALKKPKAQAANALVRSSEKSPFAVEILVLDQANAADPANGAPATIEKGFAFVEIKKNQSYRVKIHNDADFDVAVMLKIDGLDQFVFADKEHCKPDGKPQFETMAIKKKSSGVIKGWFRNLKKSDAFTVDEYSKSAVVALNAAQSDVGTISVAFHAAWDTKEELASEGAKDANATKRGEPVDQDLKVIPKFVGVCRDQVSIRYNK